MNNGRSPPFFSIIALCLPAELEDSLACHFRRDLICSCKVRFHSFPIRFSKTSATRPRRLSEMLSKYSVLRISSTNLYRKVCNDRESIKVFASNVVEVKRKMQWKRRGSRIPRGRFIRSSAMTHGFLETVFYSNGCLR
jgi:hypothetical protein